MCIFKEINTKITRGSMKFNFDNKEYDIYWTEDLHSLLEFLDDEDALKIRHTFNNDFFIKDRCKLMFLKAQKIIQLEKNEKYFAGPKYYLGKTQRSLPYLTENQVWQVEKVFRKKIGIGTFRLLLNIFIGVCKLFLIIYLFWCSLHSPLYWHVYLSINAFLLVNFLLSLRNYKYDIFYK